MILDLGRRVQGGVAGVMDGVADLRKNYELEVKERKRLFNLVQELRGNIRVFCRCRPPSKKVRVGFVERRRGSRPI